MESKPWWETNGALFGGLLSPEMCQAWTEAWHEGKGYTNAEMEAACLSLAEVHPSKRPRMPLDLIAWIENKMRANAFRIALNGHLPMERILKLLPDWEVDLETAREKVTKLGAPYETAESTAYRDLRLNLAKIRNRAHDQNQLSDKRKENACLLPSLPAIPKG